MVVLLLAAGLAPAGAQSGAEPVDSGGLFCSGTPVSFEPDVD